MFNKLVLDFFGKTPKTAKRVRNIATTIVIVAGSLWIASSSGEIILSENILSACKLIAIVGAAVGLGAQGKGDK